MGVGFGLAFSAMSALVVAAVPAEQTGVASGMNANIRLTETTSEVAPESWQRFLDIHLACLRSPDGLAAG